MQPEKVIPLHTKPQHTLNEAEQNARYIVDCITLQSIPQLCINISSKVSK